MAAHRTDLRVHMGALLIDRHATPGTSSHQSISRTTRCPAPPAAPHHPLPRCPAATSVTSNTVPPPPKTSPPNSLNREPRKRRRKRHQPHRRRHQHAHHASLSADERLSYPAGRGFFRSCGATLSLKCEARPVNQHEADPGHALRGGTLVTQHKTDPHAAPGGPSLPARLRGSEKKPHTNPAKARFTPQQEA
jgi:hypothetical protein